MKTIDDFNKTLNKVYRADCFEYVKNIPDKSIDLILTDPPYEFTKRKVTLESGSEFSKSFQKHRAEISFISNSYDFKILDEFCRIMKKINIYFFCSKLQINDYLNYFLKKGCRFEIIPILKINPPPACNNNYLQKEFLLFFREKGVKIFGDYESKKGWYLTNLNIKDKKNYDHPTIKNYKTIKDLIVNSSSENDIVFDPFLGSGTTAVVANELGRRFLGCEIEERWFKIAQNRINGINKFGQMSLFTKTPNHD